MSTLNEKILADLKQAMVAKDALRLSVLRMLIAAIKNKMIALGGGGKNELTDEQISEVIGSEIKKRKDSAEAYRQGNREDLASQEDSEAVILSGYMPAQLSAEELEVLVKETIAGLGEVTSKDFGRVMGACAAKTKGKADGNVVSAIVKTILAG